MSIRGQIRVLNVAEKPSVAKSVAEILSRGGSGMRSREGRSRYNRVFEFEYTIGGQLCHMLMTSVTGHLMEIDFEDRFRKWHSCDPADLYHAPIRKYVPQDKLDLKRTLEEESRRCHWLVLWLDCDREGENIAFEVVDVCTSANSHLNIWRARFSALIDREIHASVQNLVRPNKLFADAVDARQEIDLRIGASFTRFQTMLLRDAFVLDFAGDDRSIVLSYGPCQFPTLGFIVERYWEIQAHEPEEFWTINCSHTSEEGTATFSWMRGHLFDYTCAVIIYEMCVEDPMATVTDVKHKEKLKYPPYPLSTVELQKRASRFFRMSSEHTMKVAEELYQAGFISYPRTETDGFSVNTDLHAIVREQVVDPTWGPYAQQLLDPEVRLWRNPSNGGHDDKAHPPIHPTKLFAGVPGWTEDHKRLYEFVVRHFLACVSQPAVGAETKVEIDIAGEQFSATGLVIKARNYLDIYRFESWGGVVIPTYNIEQQFIPTILTLDSGVTRPPPLLSESDLLSCMDKAGIGTDATMHDHIKKLLDRHYATKDANTRFSPTKLGEALVMGYDDMGYELWKPYLRSMMECDMKEVSMGSKSKSQVLESCLQQMKACFLDARQNKIKLLDAMEMFFERSGRSGDAQNFGATVMQCGVCNESDMLLKRRPNGDFMVGCQRFPLCRNVVWLPGAISDANVTGNICPRCTPGPVFLIQFKFRRMEIPPNYDVDHLGCVGGCDDILRELVEICGTGSRNATPMTARGQTSDPPNATNRRNTGSTPCSRCRQAGHSSNDCPSQVSRSCRAQSTISNSRNSAGPILCNCGEPCTLRTANTESNRGRKFYACQSRNCDFFVWEENLENGAAQGRGAARGNSGRSSSSTARRGGRGRGERGGQADGLRFVSATGERVPGSCFVCGDPSHFANTCPNRGRKVFTLECWLKNNKKSCSIFI
ncbi:DNA topoisomerase 3-alpha isoform X2 [Dendrobium catenatum]|uniref:DNA topoisomerase 3-alpha isoform X2 n=2 Tax=Dendrobium catenatum TaxID=906689 RepID=UPI00109FE76A|nr:DNA topoisomerase 3-alpha isoform X2 [Dendrobium catenatum]